MLLIQFKPSATWVNRCRCRFTLVTLVAVGGYGMWINITIDDCHIKEEESAVRGNHVLLSGHVFPDRPAVVPIHFYRDPTFMCVVSGIKIGAEFSVEK